MPSPAQVRARRARVRTVGKALVALGLVGLGIATVVLLIDVSVVGIPGVTGVFCGAVVAPAETIELGAGPCGAALAEQAVVGSIAGGIGLVALLVGSIVWVRARD